MRSCTGHTYIAVQGVCVCVCVCVWARMRVCALFTCMTRVWERATSHSTVKVCACDWWKAVM